MVALIDCKEMGNCPDQTQQKIPVAFDGTVITFFNFLDSTNCNAVTELLPGFNFIINGILIVNGTHGWKTAGIMATCMDNIGIEGQDSPQ